MSKNSNRLIDKDNHAAIKVAVLEGGMSVEREVSFSSGREVKKALQKLGYEYVAVDMQQDVISRLEEIKPDVVFNALHGKYGEDGCIAGALEIAGIAYTHSGVLASSIAMNKAIAKKIFETLNIQSPIGKEYQKEELLDLINKDKFNPKEPYVIKPVNEGSSIGVHIIRQGANNLLEILDTWQYGAMLIEEYIPGREITVCVLNGEALGVTELVTVEDKFYDYDSKYTDGKTLHTMPAQIPDDVTQKACEIAEKVHKELNCRVVSRCDFRYNDAEPGEEGVYLLEVNTHPGLTPLSLLPEATSYHGIEFEQVVKILIDDALS